MIAKAGDLQTRLAALEPCEVAVSLLRGTADVSKLQYILRVVGDEAPLAALGEFDNGVRRCLDGVLGS